MAKSLSLIACFLFVSSWAPSLSLRAEPASIQPAVQWEWTPPLQGGVEQMLRQLLPSEKSMQPAPLSQPEPAGILNLSLPPETPSINLNSSIVSKAFPPAAIQLEVATMITPKTALSALLGAVLFSASAEAAEPKDDVTKAVEKLEAAIGRLQETEKSLATNVVAVVQAQKDLESLKTKVQLLEDEVKFLRQMATTPSSTSKRDLTDTAPKQGRVKLINEYPEEMKVILNERVYTLLPGQTRTVSVPAGAFTYQVMHVQLTQQERSISAEEEKPIRIYAQR